MTLSLPLWRNAIAFAALAAGCGSNHPADMNPPSGPTGDQPPVDPPLTVPPDGSQPDAPPDGTTTTPPPACTTGAATGSVLWSVDTGRGAFNLTSDELRSDLAVDADGNVLYTRKTGNAFLLTKYTPAGKLVYQVPFGEVVATDAQGNAYVAGAFAAPLDIGLGVMVPKDDMDVFVAKLAPDGTPLFARALGLCPDSVRSIAVAGDGRIAVSGDEMGTVVLDAHGELVFTRAFDGDLAFDSKGNLIVAGQFSGAIDFGGGAGFTTAGDLDGFVVKLDATGNHVWSDRIGDADLPVTLIPSGVMVSAPTRQSISAVAVGPGDEIVLAGRFDDDVKLFGTDHVANLVSAASVPLQSGGFVAALDASGAKQFAAVGLGLDGYSDVAVDGSGNVIVTGKALSDAAPPFRDALLIKLDPHGTALFTQASGIGAGHAVAVDACGNMMWSASIRQGGPDVAPEAQLFKLAH